MSATIVSFRWLDLLEKEFDKSYVDLDFILGDVEDEDTNNEICMARSKMENLSSCFAQLAHKAQSIFQLNAKLEAEILNLRHELAETEANCQVINNENKELLLHLQTTQLNLQKCSNNENVQQSLDGIHKKLIDEIKTHRDKTIINQAKKEEMVLIQRENESLKKHVIALQGELCGTKLAAKYLDKELAGRIQQLQLLRNRIDDEQHQRVWNQLESEIQLHKHKMLVRACRKNLFKFQDELSETPDAKVPKPNKDNLHRFVTLSRKPTEDLGISITGGKDGIPVIISHVCPSSIAASTEQIFVGDAIVSVNGISLKKVTHQEAVSILSSQKGDVNLELIFVLPDDDDDTISIVEDISERYKIFDEEVLSYSSSINLLQNGRLSRASIESIRGSTDDILDSRSIESENDFKEAFNISLNSGETFNTTFDSSSYGHSLNSDFKLCDLKEANCDREQETQLFNYNY